MSGTYLVVAGVDGSEAGRRALDWAVHEAAARGGAVQAVTAWTWDGVEVGTAVTVSAPEAEAHARALVQREVDDLLRRTDGVAPVSAEAIRGRPADVLARAARGADLLVLGSHGHGRVRHTVLGSVSGECIRRADCPVVVIPAPAPTATGRGTEAVARR